MYLQTALEKIENKHGTSTEAYVEFYSLPDELFFLEKEKHLRVDETRATLYRFFYEAYCKSDKANAPLSIKTFRLSLPMYSNDNKCVMYRIYQERFDGFHQVGLVTVLQGREYKTYHWMERQIETDTKKPQYPWWLKKDL